MARLPRQQWENQIAAIEGTDNWYRARQMHKGAIIATAHMGSFEIGLCAMLKVEKRIHVVFKRDIRSRFERLRRTLRERLGVIEAPVDDGLANWVRLREALLADEVVAIQADRVMPGQKGLKVPFLGGHILLPDGPARLAAITGSPILPVFTMRERDGKVRVVIEPAVTPTGMDAAAVETAVRELADVIARRVAQCPQQWLLLQKAWLEDQAPAGAGVE
jgi:KDO2-lipid IV(A) lauroyltransferase